MISRDKWYGSAEHFRTEMSYEEYVEKMKKKKKKKQTSNVFGSNVFGSTIKMPKFRF